MKNPFKSKSKGVDISASTLYDYSTPENRVATTRFLYDYSKARKSVWEQRAELNDDYYNGDHRTAQDIQVKLQSQGIPFELACVQDPFYHVESQIQPDIPDFQFSGRDDDLDSAKAKQRAYAVQFVIDNNNVEGMNTRNERRLGKLGNALWKVMWRSDIEVPGLKIGGDIKIIDVAPECCFPDPSALTLDYCEYFNYVYSMHIRAARREFYKELKDKKITLVADTKSDTKIFNSQIQDPMDDCVQVIEHWYRDDEGDIACVILINGEEIKWIEKYWEETRAQNKRYPFIKYCKIQDENTFWDRSDLDNIKELVDAADREMAYGLMNSALMSNDIIVVGENAMADGAAFENTPGAQWVMKDGQINNVRRLGGLVPLAQRESSVNFMQTQIEKTIGNFDSTMGQEPVRVTTSSGIAQLNERADARKSIKKADRNTGFQELFELVDWTCLEFYDEERMIYIGADDEEINAQYSQQTAEQGFMTENLNKSDGPIVFKYSNKKFKNYNYFPRVDCTVIASDGIAKSKAFNIQAIQDLLKIQITPENYKMVIETIKLMGLTDKKALIEWLEETYKPQPMPEQLPQDGQGAPQPDQINVDEIMAQLTPEEQRKLQAHPELIDQVMQEHMGGGQ